MPHLSVEHWEEAKQEVEPDCVGEVEADVPLVGEKDRKPFKEKMERSEPILADCKSVMVFRNVLVSLLEVGNVPQSNNTLADESQGVERDPEGVPVEKYKRTSKVIVRCKF